MVWLPQSNSFLILLVITIALLSVKSAVHSSQGFSYGHLSATPSLQRLDDENSANCTNGNEQYEYALVVDAGSSGSRIYVFRIAFSPTQNQNQSARRDPGIGGLRVEVVRDSTNHAASHKVSLTYVLEYSSGCT